MRQAGDSGVTMDSPFASIAILAIKETLKQGVFPVRMAHGLLSQSVSQVSIHVQLTGSLYIGWFTSVFSYSYQ